MPLRGDNNVVRRATRGDKTHLQGHQIEHQKIMNLVIFHHKTDDCEIGTLIIGELSRGIWKGTWREVRRPLNPTYHALRHVLGAWICEKHENSENFGHF